mgnify:CR=1 FL=1
MDYSPLESVADFGRTIQEFKHLYNDDEFMLLAEEWLIEWENSRHSS